MTDIAIVSQIENPVTPPKQNGSEKGQTKALAAFFADQDVEQKEKFIVWLSLPPLERWPKTQRALAKVIGVNSVTLSKWKCTAEIAERVNVASRRYASFRSAEFIATIFEDALNGDWRARQMIFELLGWSGEKGPSVQVTNDMRTAILVDGVPTKGLLRVGLVPDETQYSAPATATSS